jgi:hypothetical protein
MDWNEIELYEWNGLQFIGSIQHDEFPSNKTNVWVHCFSKINYIGIRNFSKIN